MGPGPAVREDTPWERRATVGWFQGLFETWKRTIFSPQHFWASVKPGGSWIDALIYAWIIFTVGVVVSAPFGSLGLGRWGSAAVLEQLQQLPPESREALRQVMGNVGVGHLVASVILYPLWIIIVAAILHLSCLVLGAAKNGYYATFRVLGYAAATNIIGMVPCLGFLAFIYGIVLTVLGIASVQETTLGRATGAVLLPLALLLCCLCAGIAFLGAGLAAMLGQLKT